MFIKKIILLSLFCTINLKPMQKKHSSHVSPKNVIQKGWRDLRFEALDLQRSLQAKIIKTSKKEKNVIQKEDQQVLNEQVLNKFEYILSRESYGIYSQENFGGISDEKIRLINDYHEFLKEGFNKNKVLVLKLYDVFCSVDLIKELEFDSAEPIQISNNLELIFSKEEIIRSVLMGFDNPKETMEKQNLYKMILKYDNTVEKETLGLIILILKYFCKTFTKNIYSLDVYSFLSDRFHNRCEFKWIN